MPRATAPLHLFFALMVASASASAADPLPDDERMEAARKLTIEGVRNARIGNTLRASELMESAYRLYPSPTIALRWGMALEELGEFGRAAEVYRVAIEQPAPAGVEPQAAADAREQAKRHLSRLEQAPPSSVAATPLVADQAQQPGLQPSYQLPTAPVITPQVQSSPDTGSTSPWVPVAVGGLVLCGAGLATGIVAGSISSGHYDDLARSCPGGQCPSAMRGTYDSAVTAESWSTGGYIVAAIGATVGATAVTLAMLSTDDDSATAGVYLGPSQLALAGKF